MNGNKHSSHTHLSLSPSKTVAHITYTLEEISHNWLLKTYLHQFTHFAHSLTMPHPLLIPKKLQHGWNNNTFASHMQIFVSPRHFYARKRHYHTNKNPNTTTIMNGKYTGLASIIIHNPSIGEFECTKIIHFTTCQSIQASTFFIFHFT